jgi:Rrf2 family protein
MLFSRGAEYGIRATLFLAANHNGHYLPIREISKELDISFHFLTKIFQKLTGAGLLKSFRGPNGGVALARSAKDISLEDVVLAIDGDDLFQNCILGLPGCGDCRPCPLHEDWADERKALQKLLSSKTIDDAAHEVEKEDLRLAGGYPCP